MHSLLVHSSTLQSYCHDYRAVNLNFVKKIGLIFVKYFFQASRILSLHSCSRLCSIWQMEYTRWPLTFKYIYRSPHRIRRCRRECYLSCKSNKVWLELLWVSIFTGAICFKEEWHSACGCMKLYLNPLH